LLQEVEAIRSNNSWSPTPALLTSISTGPASSCTWVTAPSTSPGSDRSAATTTTCSCGCRASRLARSSSSRPGAPRDQDQSRSPGGELNRELTADARGGAGDKHGAAIHWRACSFHHGGLSDLRMTPVWMRRCSRPGVLRGTAETGHGGRGTSPSPPLGHEALGHGGGGDPARHASISRLLSGLMYMGCHRAASRPAARDPRSSDRCRTRQAQRYCHLHRSHTRLGARTADRASRHSATTQPPLPRPTGSTTDAKPAPPTAMLARPLLPRLVHTGSAPQEPRRTEPQLGTQLSSQRRAELPAISTGR
jgi:hypothetical protein